MRNNRNETLGVVLTALSSGASTQTSSWIDNDYFNAAHVGIQFSSAQGSTSTLTVTIQGCVPGTTGTAYTILASTPMTAEQTRVLKVSPHITAVANNAAADFLPPKWRVQGVRVGANTVEYTIGASLSPIG